MSYRRLLLILFVLTNVSTGFSQTLADVARAERARRQGLTKGVTSANTPSANTPSANTLSANTPSANTAAKPVAREALIKEALGASGARRQVEQVVKTSLPSATNGQLPKDISAQEYRQITSEVFDVDHLMQVMGKSISGRVDDKTLVDILRWYRSPLGKKIATVEINANGPDAPTRLQRYASTLESNAPSANRQQLINGISAAGLGIPRPPADFEKTFEADRTKSISDGTALWFLFAYNTLSEAELSEYLTFLKSASAAAFNNSVWNGIDATFGDAAQQFGRKLAEKKRSHSDTASF